MRGTLSGAACAISFAAVVAASGVSASDDTTVPIPGSGEQAAVESFATFALNSSIEVARPACTIDPADLEATCYGLVSGIPAVYTAPASPDGSYDPAAFAPFDTASNTTTADASTTLVGGPISPRDLDDAFAGPVATWLADPNPDTQAAVREAAAGLMASGRAFGENLIDVTQPWLGRATPESPSLVAQWTIEAIADNEIGANDDGFLVRLLTDLALTIDLPTSVRGGMFMVGDHYVDPDPEGASVYGSIVPGTYRGVLVEDCYWETIDESGEIIDNNFVRQAPQVIFTITEDAYAFNNECGWLIPATSMS